jgi:hypothetical protein
MPLPQPIVKGHAGNTPNDAALNNSNASNQTQQVLNSIGGYQYSHSMAHPHKFRSRSSHTRNKKRKLKTHSRSFGGALTVPLIDPSYTPTGAGNQNPNGISTDIFKSSNQGDSNAQFDNLVGAGRRRRRRKTRKRTVRKKRHSQTARKTNARNRYSRCKKRRLRKTRTRHKHCKR